MKNRITPEFIVELDTDEVFVFGSNTEGLHAGGAARIAADKFGAEQENPVGLQGQSYAIPTLDFGNKILKDDKKTLNTTKMDLKQIESYVHMFIDFARSTPNKTFLVTEIGCGIAGYTIDEIAPMFRGCKDVNNVYLPKRFWEKIG